MIATAAGFVGRSCTTKTASVRGQHQRAYVLGVALTSPDAFVGVPMLYSSNGNIKDYNIAQFMVVYRRYTCNILGKSSPSFSALQRLPIVSTWKAWGLRLSSILPTAGKRLFSFITPWNYEDDHSTSFEKTCDAPKNAVPISCSYVVVFHFNWHGPSNNMHVHDRQQLPFQSPENTRLYLWQIRGGKTIYPSETYAHDVASRCVTIYLHVKRNNSTSIALCIWNNLGRIGTMECQQNRIFSRGNGRTEVKLSD